MEKENEKLNTTTDVKREEKSETAVKEESKKITKTGVIKDCKKLRVRKSPSIESEVLCVIDKSSVVTINQNQNTNEFYSITTSDGISGYCMKKFMSIRGNK